MVQININYDGGLSTTCIHSENGAMIQTDAPKDNHGQGRVFSPTDLFAASFGSCVLTLIGIQAGQLNIELTGLKAAVTKEMTKTPPRRIAKLSLLVISQKKYPAEIIEKLEYAAKNCPVAASLHPDMIIQYHFQWGKE